MLSITQTAQFVEDEANPPAFTPAEAARRGVAPDWERTARRDSHGKELVRYFAAWDLGLANGPTRPVRLVAATDDPQQRKADATWYMATNLPIGEASPVQVDEWYARRDWIEHYDKPVTHELGWADFQTRAAEAIVRHGQLVMLAMTNQRLAMVARV